jgi:zinc transporter ZupT
VSFSYTYLLLAIPYVGITIVLFTNAEMVVGRTLDKFLQSRKRLLENDESSAVKDNANQIGDHMDDATNNIAKAPETFEAIEENKKELEKDSKFDPLPAILLTVALGIHSFIEGLGIGETPDVSALESAFIAVVFHKGFTAFALAESLINTGFWVKGRRKWFFLSLGIFICIAIIGIGIGWAASPSTENATAAAFVGITSGSFIFVALHELIPEQMDRIDKGNLPLIHPIFSFWAGYGLMSMLALWA